MTRFGRTELPEDHEPLLRRAKRLERLTLGVLVVTASLVLAVLGNSQAMKAAWAEDVLSLAPPIAFLVAVRLVNRTPDRAFPYGFHRASAVAHLVAGVALLGVGAFLVVDSGSGLLAGEHPPIGTVVVLGQQVWLGWLMIATMVVTSVPMVFLGRAKLALGRQLHSKVLYADADMNKADWMTGLGTILGVAGIGAGLWWADAVAALFISVSILHDGYRNVRGAVSDLMDARATTFDDEEPDPLGEAVERYLDGLDWVEHAGTRVRDMGHVTHVEAFVVPTGDRVTTRQLERAQQRCVDLDWRLQDLVLVVVPELPEEVGGKDTERVSERNE
ncbi:cation diffusion facilitator family transporter [Auraticoccus monumenti]|uniref:Cation diffusion facilitator family transporter n=1 Tax=Auraticoccus monumenti TaxID=675864 RepID=A0A1G7BTJ5_9ACTN|nr:cation diffusion facilitator family transporter [Auraticoccus monumenti]SDE30428.1 cation diffusion facilitator family transporter [Auraticoccus monumenti]